MTAHIPEAIDNGALPSDRATQATPQAPTGLGHPVSVTSADAPRFTPGPWAWFGNRSGGVYLATTHSGRRYVMGFRRYGMNGAQPTFQIGGIMYPAADLVSFAVGDGAARGFKEADKDRSVYRYDVDEIDHPDARLIAAAPDLYEAADYASIIIDRLKEDYPPSSIGEEWLGTATKLLDAALAKARGQ